MIPTKAKYLVFFTFLFSLLAIESKGQIPHTLDSLPPKIGSCPLDSTVIVDSYCGFLLPDYTDIPTVVDDSTATQDLIVTQWPPSGVILESPDSVWIVTLTVTDAIGNSSDCSFNITLEDQTAPEVICPDSLTLYIDTTQCSVLGIDLGIAAVSDNCSLDTLISNAPASLYVGQTVVAWTAVDLSGNSSTCTQKITIIDSIAPIIFECPDDRTVSSNSNGLLVMTDYTSEVNAMDNCSPESELVITQSPLPGDSVSGDQWVSIQVEDQSGNQSSCQFMITHNIFTDVALERGIQYTGKTFGSSWADMDGNGYMDLFMSCHSNAGEEYLINDIPRFFYNQDGIFTSELIEDALGQNDWHAGSFFDHDNDGDLELYGLTGGTSGNILIEDLTGPIFLDRANDRGLSYPGSRGRTATPCDINLDGHIDIILSCLSNNTNSTTLFLNQAGNGFIDIGQYFPLPIDHSVFCSLIDLDFSGNQHYVFMENVPNVYAIENGEFVLKTSLKVPRTQSFVFEDFNGDLLPDAYLARGSILPGAVLMNDTTIRTKFEYLNPSGPMGISFQTSGELQVEFSPFYNQFILHLGTDSLAYYSDKVTLEFSPTSASVQGLSSIDPFTSLEHIFFGYDSLINTWTLQITNNSQLREKFGIQVRSTETIQNLTTLNFPYIPETKDLLYFNNGDGTFTRSDQAISNDEENGLAVLSGDFDNDMDMDVYVINSGFAKNSRNILMENDGQGNFIRHEDAWGARGDGEGIGESATIVDYDNNGFLDLFVCNGRDVFFLDEARPNLYHNRGNSNHWIKLNLKGTISNPMGLHSRVKVYSGGIVQARYQDGGTHKFSQNDSRLHFGLGSNSSVDSIIVEWPSGIHQVIFSPAIDQIIEITEAVDSCTPPEELAVIELGFGTNNPRISANWHNPEGTSECEVRRGRISDASVSSGTPEFQNINNTGVINQTNGTSLNHSIRLLNNDHIEFIPGVTYGFEARCMCAAGKEYSEWSGLNMGSIFTVPFPPGWMNQNGEGKNGMPRKAVIYPNPSTGRLFIYALFSVDRLAVYDLLGRSAMDQLGEMTSLPDSSISLSLEHGIYIIELYGTADEKEVIRAIVF